jgi:hypothetical protein
MAARLPLRPDVEPSRAAEVLRQLIGEARSIGPSVGVFDLQQSFLTWAETTESQLHYLTHDMATLTMFDTARGRMLYDISPAVARPWPLVDAEVTLRVSVLERMLEDLEARIARAKGAGGVAVVPDTNILLHYKPLDELPWQQLVGAERVRVVLPLRVVEEIDQKKYAARGSLARQARRLLPQLKGWLGPAGKPSELAAGVTLEVMVDPGPRQRPVDADEEILASCRELSQFGVTDLKLLTADIAMSIRAQAEGIGAIELSPDYLRSEPSERR